jgi:hypothetical protein
MKREVPYICYSIDVQSISIISESGSIAFLCNAFRYDRQRLQPHTRETAHTRTVPN